MSFALGTPSVRKMNEIESGLPLREFVKPFEAVITKEHFQAFRYTEIALNSSF